MTRAFLLCFALAVACCAKPPVPPPPETHVAPPVDLAALETSYAISATRLRVYLAQPPCAPSGAIACRDPINARGANTAERQAKAALDAARKGTGPLHIARTKVEVFQTIVRSLVMPPEL